MTSQAPETTRAIERTVIAPLEDEQMARPRSRDNVGSAVPIQVHDLRTEANTSARGNLTDTPTCTEPLELTEPRGFTRSDVAIDAHSPLAELSYEEIRTSIAIPVVDERGGVASVYIDRCSARCEPDGRCQPGTRRWLSLRYKRQPQEYGDRVWSRHAANAGR